MGTEILVNIGSGNGLLPDGTKPLPEPMLTDHQWSPVTFILEQFHRRYLKHQSVKPVWKLHVWKFHWNFPGVNELTWQWGMPPCSYCWHYYTGTLSSLWSHCDSVEDRIPVDFIHRYSPSLNELQRVGFSLWPSDTIYGNIDLGQHCLR